MFTKTLGFIGGGRVTRLMLQGFRNRGLVFPQIVVSDTSPEVLETLKTQFPEITIALNDNAAAASQEWVFLAVHPPAMSQVLNEIATCLHPDTVLVSLAPKWTISQLHQQLGDFNRIVRMIPNAPSFINQGYNPCTMSPDLPLSEKQQMRDALETLGECPEVEEDKLEAYAILTAMGPTYFWFQWEELKALSQSFGLSPSESQHGLYHMLKGAVEVFFTSDLKPSDVIDLVPVKPLGNQEAAIREIYQTQLSAIFAKLKG